jgi:ribosomal protein S18 acetylase RimI-like enzyme
VLDDGSGRAVGYCIGCPDVGTFMSRYDDYATSVLDTSDEVSRPADVTTAREPWADPDTGEVSGTCLSQMAYNPTWLLLDGNEDVTGEYGATMHVDLLEGWQGQGWGRRLVERFFESVREAAAGAATTAAVSTGEEGKAAVGRGIWIGVAQENDKVVPFYERLGFRVKREGNGSICMVKDLW